MATSARGGAWLLVLAVLLLSNGCAQIDAMGAGKDVSTLQSKPLESGHAPVNGINMYYEVHGRRDGVPLVLLHGGGSTIEVTFSRVLPVFAGSRRVIAVEEQGHGRTTDRDAPVTFESSADDVAALLRSPEGRQGGHLRVQQRRQRRAPGRHTASAARAKAGLRFVVDQERRRSTAALGVHEAGGLLEHAAAAQGRVPAGEPGRAAAQDHARQGRREDAELQGRAGRPGAVGPRADVDRPWRSRHRET